MLPNFGPFAKDKTEFICQAEDSVWRSCGNPQVAELVRGALIETMPARARISSFIKLAELDRVRSLRV